MLVRALQGGGLWTGRSHHT